MARGIGNYTHTKLESLIRNQVRRILGAGDIVYMPGGTLNDPCLIEYSMSTQSGISYEIPYCAAGTSILEGVTLTVVTDSTISFLSS